jgi:hypothetical protein
MCLSCGCTNRLFIQLFTTATRFDVSDVTLSISAEKEKPKGEHSDTDYTIIDVKSKTEKITLCVAFFGRTDVESFCDALAKICRSHNVPAFIAEFRLLPQGALKKKYETVLYGTFLRQGLKSGLWSRKSYRVCRVEDSSHEHIQIYGELQFGDETDDELPAEDVAGCITLADLSIAVDSRLQPGSDVIILSVLGEEKDDVHKKIVLILDPYGVIVPSPMGSDSDSDAEGSGRVQAVVAAEKKKKRERPTVDEICTFLSQVGAVAQRSNATVSNSIIMLNRYIWID